eukprot:704041-Pelagomonas_calceolata.AAC.9
MLPPQPRAEAQHCQAVQQCRCLGWPDKSCHALCSRSYGLQGFWGVMLGSSQGEGGGGEDGGSL